MFYIFMFPQLSISNSFLLLMFLGNESPSQNLTLFCPFPSYFLMIEAFLYSYSIFHFCMIVCLDLYYITINILEFNCRFVLWDDCSMVFADFLSVPRLY